MSKKATRRQFLTGEVVSGQATDGPESGSPDPATYVLEVSRDAMACQFQVMLNAGQDPKATEVAIEALDLVDVLEQQLTVYRPDSEISLLNDLAFEFDRPVERQLLELLHRCGKLHFETSGAFDITAGPLSELWGFHRREGRIPSDEEIQQVLQVVGAQHLQIDLQKNTIRYLKEGLKINLGSVGKGFALDRCAQLLLQHEVGDFLIHGGYSSVLARGRRMSGSPKEMGWRVRLRDPYRPENKLGEICLMDRAPGTSGLANQSFIHAGKRYGHILDPRTGYPAMELASVTVLAPSGEVADTLATSLFVMGKDQAIEFLESHPELGALLVVNDRKHGRLEVTAIGLEEPEWTPVS